MQWRIRISVAGVLPLRRYIAEGTMWPPLVPPQMHETPTIDLNHVRVHSQIICWNNMRRRPAMQPVTLVQVQPMAAPLRWRPQDTLTYDRHPRRHSGPAATANTECKVVLFKAPGIRRLCGRNWRGVHDALLTRRGFLGQPLQEYWR